MAKNKDPVSLKQSTHKAWAGAIAMALVPIIKTVWEAFFGQGLPIDDQLLIDLLKILVEALVLGLAGYGFVYRTTNYYTHEEEEA